MEEVIGLLLLGWVTVWSSGSPAVGADLIDLRAGGDVMLARFVGRVAERRGGDALFASVRGLFDGSDLAFANLESPLTVAPIARRGPFRFAADPRLAPALGLFDAVSIENNHALDAGEAGRAETIAVLERAGIAALGAASFEARGRRVFVAAFDAVEGTSLPVLDVSADHRVVLAHWGIEYAAEPSPRQLALASELVAQGADLILGAHPHVVQPVREIRSGARRGVVAFSLGNLVFDQESRGMVVRALIGRDGVARIDARAVEISRGVPVPVMRAVLGFDGAFFFPRPLATPPTSPLSRTSIDLRGDGKPLEATLVRGVVEVRERGRVVWRNEEPSWRVHRMEAGDPDRDGRLELLLLLEKNGVTHPFIMGERRGRFRIIWGGSATARPIRDFALGDFDGDRREELAVIDGDGELSIWRWFAWGFEEIARSVASRMKSVDARDLDGDGTDELIVEEQPTERSRRSPGSSSP